MKYLKFNKKKISYGRQHISNDDVLYVKNSLRSDIITQGEYVKLFEKKINSFFGSKYSVAVSSGTAALHLSMLSLDLKKTDKVLTSPISFLASANCIEYVGAKVDFCDINKNTYTIDPEKVESKLKKDRNIKVIIGVDYAGHPADWESLHFLKKKYNLRLINDNCHAVGAKIKNNQSYAVKYADIVTQSFHPVKHITTGEGGAIITNNKNLYNKIRILRSHGIERNKVELDKRGLWFYKMRQLGFNYRISDINCALGVSQFRSVKKFINKRRSIANTYNKLLEKIPNLILPRVEKDYYHSYHLYPILINFKKLKIKKTIFFNKMKKYGVALQVHYIPIYQQPYYKKKYKFNPKNFPISENFYLQEVSLPIFYSFKKKDQIKLISIIKKILKVK
tara:strand:- start:4675 stop:5853 length:1179 start_codon:yes stop_codon:yes gene_type:complete